jgi:hypothetical protein
MRFTTILLALAAACTLAADVAAQSNNDDYTPLNSRIRREQKYPLDVMQRWRDDVGPVTRSRSREMMTQFSKCMYNRSREGAVELLATSDYGLNDFAQIGLERDRAMRVYGFDNCMTRVANTHNSGVLLRFNAGSLRQWLLQEAYFDRYPDGPSWVSEGMQAGERTLPLSADNQSVRWAMALADCVVATDPFTADFFFRTTTGSPEEGRALEVLGPLMSPCLPQGQQVELQIPLVRAWIGEALWHAATNSVPVPPAAGAGVE